MLEDMINSVYTKINQIFETSVFKYLFFIVAIIYSASFATWVLFDDNYYYYTIYDRATEFPMSILYMLLGKFWINNISSNILSVNLLGWMFCISSITLLYLSFISRKNWKIYLNYLSIGIVFMGYWTQNIFNPDSVSLLIMVTMLILLFKRCIRSSWSWVIIALLSALLIATRFPNILVLPVVCIYMFIDYMQNKISPAKAVGCTLGYLLMTAFIYGLLMCAMLQTTDLIGYMYTYLNRELVASRNTHDPFILFCWYRDDMMITIKHLTMVIGSVGCAYLLGFTKSKKTTIRLITLLFPIYILFKFRSEFFVESYGWKTFFGFSMSLLLLHNAYHEGKFFSYVKALLIIAFSFIMAAGSDTGLQKCALMFAAFSPVVLIQYKKLVGFNEISKGLLLIYLVATTCLYSSFIKGANLNSLVNYPNATLLSNEETKTQLENRCQVLMKYKIDGHTLMYGIKRYAVETVTGVRGLYKGSFFSFANDDLETTNVVKLFNCDSKSVLIDYSKSEMLKEKMNIQTTYMCQESNVANIYKHK